jgi:putative ABC transport system ATP-binding protein
MSDALLSMRGIVKRYSAGAASTAALAGIDLDVRKGEFLCITGPSGSGKSTLLSILGLLENYDEGRYLVDGVDVGGAPRDTLARARNRHFGFVFQAFNLIPEYSALKNVAMPLKFRGGLTGDACTASAKAALEDVGLADKLTALPSQLSGGQQQRVAIARALVGKPDVLLADEPTGNLDSASAGAIMDLICGLHARGTTTVLVTHDPHIAALASRIVTLVDGRIV